MKKECEAEAEEAEAEEAETEQADEAEAEAVGLAQAMGPCKWRPRSGSSLGPFKIH